MTAHVNRVVGTLSEAGYRTVSMPMVVSNVTFEFPAALVGSGHSQDLIIVADCSDDSEKRIRQKIEALARALDLVESRRSLTVVLTGPRPSQILLEALTHVCRVLPTGAPSFRSDQALRDKLAVLLPLDITEIARTIADPERELSERIKLVKDKTIVRDLVAAAYHGPGQVEKQLRTLIEQAFEEVDSN